MVQKRGLGPVQPASETQEESPAKVGEERSKELPGVSTAPPSFYHCDRCNKDILAQDVVWETEDEPHCPECDSILKSRQQRTL
jgi:DNA-directed RNA polymerase subunit RPC12/RpoP